MKFKFSVIKDDGDIWMSDSTFRSISPIIFLMLQRSSDEWDRGQKSNKVVVTWI